MTTSKKSFGPWVSDEYWVSPYNFEAEVTNRPDMPSRIKIHDTTLRDGEQTPGVVFRSHEKVAIAKMLDEMGVDQIETMAPIVSKEDEEAIRRIVDLDLDAELYCSYHAGRKVEELDFAVSLGVDGIGIPVAVGYPRLKYEHPDWTEDDAINIALKSISLAKEKGVKVTLSLVDTSRSEKRFLERMITTVSKSAPPDAFNITDTTGCLLPKAAATLVRFVKQWTAVPVEIHTHNDLGLGLANTLSAIEAGAEIVDVSVNGLGERGGNVALDELAGALHFLYGRETKIDYRRLNELSRMIEKLSNIPLNRNKPLVGDGIYWRESGLGINLVKEEPLALFSIVPETVGQHARIVLGKKSGLGSVEYKAGELGIKELTDREQKKKVLAKVKERSTEKKGLLDDNEFREIVSSVLKGK